MRADRRREHELDGAAAPDGHDRPDAAQPGDVPDASQPGDDAPAGGGGGRRRGGTALLLAGALLVAGAAAWQGYSWLWTRHAESVGHHLVADHDRRLAAAAAAGDLPACTSAGSSGGTGTGTGTGSGDPVVGVLSIPAIGVTAPVEQGTADPTLAVAVGHVTASVWPGAPGTAVLAAHDVSYFVGIDQLADGDVVDYVTPCTTYRFAVSGHQVVQAGSPLYNSTASTVVLETCWPTDALWYTPDRLLVTATEIGTVPTTVGARSAGELATAGAAASAQAPAVDAPAPLVAQGLTLTTNSIPMGTMTELGDPASSWTSSPAPLAVESSALEAFIGDLRSAEQGRASWWAALSPAVPVPTLLDGASVADWHQGLDVAITASGTDATAVTLTATVTVDGGSAPGLYDLTVDEAIGHHALRVTAWQMTPTAT